MVKVLSPALLFILMGVALIGSMIAWLQYGHPGLGQALWGASALAGVLAVRAVGWRNRDAT
jgi:hypothetical protein